jgi:hypothetical protein
MQRLSIESDRTEESSSISIVLEMEEGGVSLECSNANKVEVSSYTASTFCGARSGGDNNLTPTAAPNHCHFWLQFPGFIPDPAAQLQEDFARLASHMRWSKAARRKHLAEAIRAEIGFFYDGSGRLARWQSLCNEVRVGSNPRSIAECKKVRVKPRPRNSRALCGREGGTITARCCWKQLTCSRYSDQVS